MNYLIWIMLYIQPWIRFKFVLLLMVIGLPLLSLIITPIIKLANAQQQSPATQEAGESFNNLDFALKILKEKVYTFSVEKGNQINDLTSKIQWWENCVKDESCINWVLGK